VLILAVGIIAFFNSYFGAGTVPGSLLPPKPDATATAGPAATVAKPAPSGPVVFTALEDNVWVRLYEQGGERLTERTLMLGDTLEVPVAARDPRINTGRPDALSVTIGGQPFAKLADQPVTIAGVPVSAAALAARGTPTPVASGTPATPAAGTARPPRPARRRVSPPAAESGEGEAAAPQPAAEAAPAPVADPAPAPGR
jgi:hypothetical protein